MSLIEYTNKLKRYNVKFENKPMNIRDIKNLLGKFKDEIKCVSILF